MQIIWEYVCMWMGPACPKEFYGYDGQLLRYVIYIYINIETSYLQPWVRHIYLAVNQ